MKALGQPSRATHSASWRQASFKTNESILPMSPCCSAKGMKSSGADSPLGMAPAHERLDADQRLVVQGEERLVEEEQFLAIDRTAQLGLEAARPGGDALGGAEDPIAVPPCLLGLVHCPVGIAD